MSKKLMPRRNASCTDAMPSASLISCGRSSSTYVVVPACHTTAASLAHKAAAAPTSKTLPRGEAPNPSTDTSSPVVPRRRLGRAAAAILLGDQDDLVLFCFLAAAPPAAVLRRWYDSRHFMHLNVV